MAYQPPIPDQISASNSSTTPLLASATFTGAAVDCTAQAISSVTVFSFSDQASATNGLQIQWSQDGTNWNDHIQHVSVMANESGIISDKVRSRYFRVVYINGAVNQGSFRLQTLISATNTSGTVRDLDTTVEGDDEAQLVRAVITGTSITTSDYIDVSTDSYGSIPVIFSPSVSDAFGRARVSPPQTLFNISFEYDAQPLIMQTVVVGAGTAAKTSNVSTVTLSTGGTTNGDGVIFQSKPYLRYEPGKSLQIVQTGVIGAAKANVRSQIGYFDANNGLFFDQNNGMNVTTRTHTSGSPVDTAVAQANWNLDHMDGTGPSGVTLDFTKEQVFEIDLQWLGSGRVRFGFIVDGILYYCHQFLNANSLSLPYTNTACLPVRWEIHNTGTAASTTTMIAGCGAVLSEGGNDRPQAYEFTASNSATSITAGNGTRTPLVSIQAKTTFNSITNRARVLINEVSLVVPGSNAVFWELVYNGSLTGASFASVDSNSVVNKDVAASACTGGTVVASGYCAGTKTSGQTIDISVAKRLPLTLDAAGSTADIYTLCAAGIGATSATNGEISWTEER